MRKILALDIDGVLNSKTGFARDKPKTMRYMQDEPVAQLARIMREVPGIETVLSSTWRRSTPHKLLQRMLRKRGVFINIIGTTPMTLSSRERGHEIQAWLDDNGGAVTANRLVILDDDNDMLHLTPHLVRTSWEVGLTAEKADDVIRRFRHEVH